MSAAAKPWMRWVVLAAAGAATFYLAFRAADGDGEVVRPVARAGRSGGASAGVRGPARSAVGRPGASAGLSPARATGRTTSPSPSAARNAR